jgi:hypothetical protein
MPKQANNDIMEGVSMKDVAKDASLDVRWLRIYTLWLTSSSTYKEALEDDLFNGGPVVTIDFWGDAFDKLELMLNAKKR